MNFYSITLLVLAGNSISSMAAAAATNATWPTCYEIGADFDGDDVIFGLRFSEDDCANWCTKVGSR